MEGDTPPKDRGESVPQRFRVTRRRSAFSIPSYRHDLTEYFDLIEEVARIVGYDTMPATAPVSPLLPVSRPKADTDIDAAKDVPDRGRLLRGHQLRVLRRQGHRELSPHAREPDPDERASFVPLLNPISKELGVMRTFLAARLLENIAYNINRGTKNLRLFEIGKVFFRSDGSVLPRESMHLACAISGKEREYFWRDSVKDFDFFDLKGVLEGLFERFNLRLRVVRAEESFSRKRGRLRTSSPTTRRSAGSGRSGTSVRAAYNADEKVWCAELDLDATRPERDPGKDLQTHTPLPGRGA